MTATLNSFWKRAKALGRRKVSPASIIAPNVLFAAELAFAQAANNPGTNSFIASFGCQLLRFFVGDLAIWAFLGVAVGTILIGLVAKIDFAKLITVVVIFGVLQGLTAFFTSSGGMGKVGNALSQNCSNLYTQADKAAVYAMLDAQMAAHQDEAR